MKKIPCIAFLSAILLPCAVISSCGKDDEQQQQNEIITGNDPEDEQKEIRILGKFNERLEFVGKIGDNFDSALDSLQRKYEPWFCGLVAEGHYSGEGYIISKEKMNVDFSYDDRDFILLTFIDKSNQYNYLITGDVLDGRGNYYRLVERED